MKKKIISLAVSASLLTGCSLPDFFTGGKEFKFTAIDVGKGDCLLLQEDGHNVLIDTGYRETVDDVLEYLESSNVTSLDYLIISHYDKDHVGGAAAVIEALDVNKVYLPDYNGESEYYLAFMEALENRSVDYSKVSEDTSFTLGDVDYTIYQSDIDYTIEEGASEGNDNDVSLLVSALFGEDSYLFTGDIEKEGISSWLAKSDRTYDVIKMPHHGDKISVTQDLVTATAPKVAVITDSTEEDAKKKTVAMLEEAGAEVYQTAYRGTIVVSGRGSGKYSVRCEKKTTAE